MLGRRYPTIFYREMMKQLGDVLVPDRCHRPFIYNSNNIIKTRMTQNRERCISIVNWLHDAFEQEPRGLIHFRDSESIIRQFCTRPLDKGVRLDPADRYPTSLNEAINHNLLSSVANSRVTPAVYDSTEYHDHYCDLSYTARAKNCHKDRMRWTGVDSSSTQRSLVKISLGAENNVGRRWGGCAALTSPL